MNLQAENTGKQRTVAYDVTPRPCIALSEKQGAVLMYLIALEYDKKYGLVIQSKLVYEFH